MKGLIKKFFRTVGYDVVPRRWSEVPDYKNRGFDRDFVPLYERCRPFTMTSAEKMFALWRAVNYLAANRVDGAFVECGVAAGGSMMMAALTALAKGNAERDIWLYDTYAGMPEPTQRDVNYRGDDARKQWASSEREGFNEWCFASLESVRRNLASTGYPNDRLHFVVGRVEDTIPANMPDQIALLRLDTDWYVSSKHELVHLYPRLCSGGVLIIDDYSYWEGCRQATDEFFQTLAGSVPLLNRIDRLGVIAVKPARL